MTANVEHLERSLVEVREVVLEMVRHGRLEDAAKLALDGLREALVPLAKSVAELTADVCELKSRIEELTDGLRELRESTAELERGVRGLCWSLKKEVELRRKLESDVRRLRGDVTRMKLGDNLAYWCGKHGLDFERLPREPFRVDGVITGKRIVALVEIATTGDEADVEQLLEGARVDERERGERPNALVLYIGVRPSRELIDECEKHGILLENSPRRIARRLAEMDGIAEAEGSR